MSLPDEVRMGKIGEDCAEAPFLKIQQAMPFTYHIERNMRIINYAGNYSEPDYRSS